MNSELPIQLYKANAELQLQITRLLQESGHHWLEAMQQLSAGGVLETTSRIQNLQQAADWQALFAATADDLLARQPGAVWETLARAFEANDPCSTRRSLEKLGWDPRECTLWFHNRPDRPGRFEAFRNLAELPWKNRFLTGAHPFRRIP